MGAMFRSEEMALCQLFIQPEAAYPSLSELGETGTVQFRDLNSNVNSFQRKFVSEVRRCDELERKLRYIEAELNKDNVTIPDVEEVPRAPNPREIIDLETHLEKTESEILELSHNAVNLKSNFLELTELRHVLEKTESFFASQDGSKGGLGDAAASALMHDEATQTTIRGRLGFVAGVVPRERVPAFERMLWRISRGNVFLRQAELDSSLEDPATGNEIFKTVFVAFFQGEQLKSRVKKVCSGFHASLYPCPNVPSERQDMVKGVNTRLEDLHLVLDQTKDHRQRVLVTVAKQIQTWMIQVRKMKAIYHTLNMFNMDVTKKCLIAECWVPVGDLPLVRKALSDGGTAAASSIPSFLNVIETPELPPTFNRTNKFTRGFQNLIDSYGIASYREVNPALYTIITFPFLFGIMFGDAGHGLILLSFGAYLCLDEKRYLKKKSLPEVFAIFFDGRYIILLMGFFSIYTGIIYNDVFSKSVNIFGSSWQVKYNQSTVAENNNLQMDPATLFAGSPYPLGLDPVWQLAINKIVFLNSFKMKMSIIIGVVHMIFGVCLSVVNHVNFNPTNIIFDFIPQLLFLILLFAYMCVMMFMKWAIYSPTNPTKTSPRCAPSVLIYFINMMLFKENTHYPECDEFMFDGQGILQKVLVVVALICIPWLLFAKPIYLIIKRRKPRTGEHEMLVCQAPADGAGNGAVSIEMNETSPSSTSSAPAGAAGGGHNDHDNQDTGELLIYQAIHTIEYVLSTISHTASYLRLWALSLAHSQLSEVLWGRLFNMALSYEGGFEGGVMVFLLFGVWAVFTIAILVMMEGLSAFLHTLRLHWVEFMTKFYQGLGYAFQPFSFKSILESEEGVIDE